MYLENTGMYNRNMNKWLKLLIAVVIVQGAGILGSLFTASKIESWYAGIVKPIFNPPNWIFGPVWTVLYILIAIAFWLVWIAKVPGKSKVRAYTAFWVQLALNVLWSVAFFGLESPLLAMNILVALWIMILVTMVHFSRVSKIAAWLLLPYLLWVSFAGVLNYYIWRLNG